jgi:hypothetical protein
LSAFCGVCRQGPNAAQRETGQLAAADLYKNFSRSVQSSGRSPGLLWDVVKNVGIEVERKEAFMEYIVAVVLGLIVAGFAATSGFDRDRSFYPTVLIVVASYYSLFATMGASGDSTVAIETAAGMVFAVLAFLAFKRSMWLAALGIAGHGFFDFFVHPSLVTNPGMPIWWPGFCGTIDILLGAWVAIRLWKSPQSVGAGKTK